MNEKLKDFTNPIGDWHYPGSPGLVCIMLAQHLDKTIIPSNEDTMLEKQLLTCRNATISETSNALLVTDSNGKSIFLAYKFVRYVYGEHEKLIWVNPSYKSRKVDNIFAMTLVLMLTACMSCSSQRQAAEQNDRNPTHQQMYALRDQLQLRISDLQSEVSQFRQRSRSMEMQSAIDKLTDEQSDTVDSLMTVNKRISAFARTNH